MDAIAKTAYALPQPELCARRSDPATIRTRTELSELVRELPEGALLMVDLGGNDYDISPLDEMIVSNILTDIASRQLQDRYVCLTKVTRYTRKELEAAMKLSPVRPLAVIALDDLGKTHVVGDLGEKATRTIEWLTERGEATAAELAKAFELSLPAANNRLADLWAIGLLRRRPREAARGAREFLYAPVL